MKDIHVKENTILSRRDAVQKLAGLGVAAGAVALALSPEKAFAAADYSYLCFNSIRGGPINIPDNALAVVASHSSLCPPGTSEDGGGGLFYWDKYSTETDNDATVIQIGGVATGRWKRAVTDPLNVKWFGATGNGSTDDTTAINNAINFAVTQANAGTGSPCILFPGGKYYIGMQPTNGLRLAPPNGYSGKLHLCGVGDVILYHPGNNDHNLSSDTLLGVVGPNFRDILIENLTFQRAAGKPPPTAGQTTAIALNGDTATILRPIIRNCIFQDFSVAVSLSSTEGALVTGCRWKYTDGSACATSIHPSPVGTLPAVGLMCSSAIHTQVIDNYWAGTEKVASSAIQPMDGFTFGWSKGWIIKNNVVRRAAFEGIYPWPTGDATETCIIEGNYVDCEMPAVYPGVGRVAIFTYEDNVMVTGNNIRHALGGIAVSNPNTNPTISHGGIVSNNNITFEQADSQIPGLYGILVGSRQGLSVQNNRIYFSQAAFAATEQNPSSGIAIANSQDITITGNQVYADFVGTNGPAYTLCGVYLWNGSSITSDAWSIIEDNVFQNLGCGIWAPSAFNPAVTFWQIGHNTYLNVALKMGRYSTSTGKPWPLAIASTECMLDIPTSAFCFSQPGWYRIFRGIGFINGKLSIVAAITPNYFNSAYPQERLDGEYILDYDYGSQGTFTGTGAIHQVNSGRSSKYVTQIRISQYTDYISLAVDVYIATPPPQSGIRFIFEPGERWVEPTTYGNVYAVPFSADSFISTQYASDPTGFGNHTVLSLPAAQGILTSGRVLFGDGIGGNVATAVTATPGNVSGKIKVYDESGNFIGFLPVYGSL